MSFGGCLRETNLLGLQPIVMNVLPEIGDGGMIWS